MKLSLLYSQEQIAERVASLGFGLTKLYQAHPPLVLVVLKGAMVFGSDLIRELKLEMDLSFVGMASYKWMCRSEIEKYTIPIDDSVRGRRILVIEDIVDTGRTILRLKRDLEKYDPVSIQVCTLLDKTIRREVDVEVEFAAFGCPDKFVIGYGLDYNGRGRNLPEIYTIEV
jgi:hypoxanthine phosphoribosyltransferase